MCKTSTTTHDLLADKQVRLDARGNDKDATRRESQFVKDLFGKLDGSGKKLLADHFAHLADKPGGRSFKVVLEQEYGSFARNPMKMVEMMSAKEGVRGSPFKSMLDNQVNALKYGEPYKTMHKKCREMPFFSPRGRADKGRTRLARTGRDQGIQTSDKGTLSDGFTVALTHAQDQVVQVRDETRQKFQESGAPFIAGASGTIEYLCLSLEEDKPRKSLSKGELKEREKLLSIYMATMVLSGHHSLSECLLSAQAMGYFAGVPDPLKDYDGAMKAFQAYTKKLDLDSDVPLSKTDEDEGKSAKQLLYEATLRDVDAFWDKYGDQLGIAPSTFDSQRLYATEAVTNGSDYDEGTRLLARLKGNMELLFGQVVSERTGHPKIIDGASLVQKFGAPPSTKKKRSLAYKEARQGLDGFDETFKLSQGMKLTNELAERTVDDLDEQLAIALKGCDDYIAKFGTSTNEGKKARVAEMRKVKAEIEKERKALDFLQDHLAEYATHNPSMTLDQAMKFARFEIPGGDIDVETLGDDHVDSSRILGSGAVNTVYLNEYGDKTRVIKFDPESEKLPTAPRYLGLDGDDPHFGKRNIASRRMADKMGLGPMMPEVKMTLQDGKVAIAMDLAPGKTPWQDPWIPTDESDTLPPSDKDVTAGKYKLFDTTWKKKGRLYVEDLPFEEPPETSAKIQEQLMNLQWLDGLCGQGDRHAQNYLMDVSSTGEVRVTGIDNDFCFGEGHDKVETTKYSGIDLKIDTGVIGVGYCGKPPLIPRAIYTQLTTVAWSELEADMKGLLTDKEIAAAKSRHEDLVAHARSLNPDFVVDDFMAWRSPAPDDPLADDAIPGGMTAKTFLASYPKGKQSNYFQRELMLQREARLKHRITRDGEVVFEDEVELLGDVDPLIVEPTVDDEPTS